MNLKKVSCSTLLATPLLILVSCTSGCKFSAQKILHALPAYKSHTVAPESDNTTNGVATVDSIGTGTNEITVLTIEATNYFSIGYWHGLLLAKEANENIHALLGMADELVAKEKIIGLVPKGSRKNLIKDELHKAWKIMEPFVPRQDLEEIAGFVKGMQDAGIKIDKETVEGFLAIPDLGESSCSAFAACASATTDGHVYQMRLLDYGLGSGLENNPLITVVKGTRPGENTYVNIGWAGFIGLVTGINEKGMCISEMGYRNPPGERLDATPMIFLLKQAFRYADSTREAVAILRAAQRNNSYAYWVGDPSGDLAGLLTAPDSFLEYKVNAHDVVVDVKKSRRGKPDKITALPQYKDAIYAGQNSVAQGEIVKRDLGRFNLQTIQGMAKKIGMESNMQTVIFDLTTLDLHVANAHGTNRAADCVYVKFPREAWKK